MLLPLHKAGVQMSGEPASIDVKQYFCMWIMDGAVFIKHTSLCLPGTFSFERVTSEPAAVPGTEMLTVSSGFHRRRFSRCWVTACTGGKDRPARRKTWESKAFWVLQLSGVTFRSGQQDAKAESEWSCFPVSATSFSGAFPRTQWCCQLRAPGACWLAWLGLPKILWMERKRKLLMSLVSFSLGYSLWKKGWCSHVIIFFLRKNKHTTDLKLFIPVAQLLGRGD